MDNAGQLVGYAAVLAPLVWAVTQVIKPLLTKVSMDVDPSVVAFIVALVITALAFASGYVKGNWFEVGATVIMAVLGGNAAQNYLHKPGLGGGAAGGGEGA